MGTRIFLAAAVVLVFAASFWAKARLDAHPPMVVQPAAFSHSRRIVSMAPSITETLYALGLGDRVAGVTSYCNYPPQACQKPKIGGYLNPNFEAIVALQPDLVVLLAEAGQPTTAFDKLGLATLRVDHRSVEGILDSIRLIGSACGAGEKARAIVADIDRRLGRIERATAGRTRPRVLIAIDRTLGTGRLEDVYIAGRDGHIDRIIQLAGGTNAYSQGKVRFPVVSPEGILEMDPQVIVDLVPGLAGREVDEAAIRADWESLGGVSAVRRGRVYLVADDFATVPGPRFILFVEKLARLIHPQVEWGP